MPNERKHAEKLSFIAVDLVLDYINQVNQYFILLRSVAHSCTAGKR